MARERLSGSRAKTAASLLLAVTLACGLAACGQRGPLVPPNANTNAVTSIDDPAAPTDPMDAATREDTDPSTTSATTAPKAHFILDPLL